MQSTVNNIINSNINICQPTDGFRFSSDAIYLAWFSSFTKSSHTIDIGSGSGVISALLAALSDEKKIDAVELQTEMFSCLTETIRLSKLEKLVTPINCDIKKTIPPPNTNMI